MSSLVDARPVRRLSATTARTFRSLRVRNYRLWFAGQTISLSGTWMQATAQAWLVWSLTHNAFYLGFTAALQFLPVLLLGAYGGVVADRFDKRRVLVATQTLFMVQALLIWLTVATGVVQLWMVWVLALAMGLINVFDNPSRQSFAIEMVGSDDLANAVGLNSVIVNGSRIVGPAVAGVLIWKVGLSWTFLLNAASFVAVLAALLAMRPGELHRVARLPAARGQVRAGLRYAWNNWELRVPLLMMAVVGTLSYNFMVILPLFASTIFHRGGGTYGALTAAMGIGALAGALAVASRRRPRYQQLVLVTFAFGALAMAVAVAPTLLVALVLLVPMGAASVAFIALANSLLQVHSTGQMRGRVMSLWAIVFLGSTPIGAPLTGLVAGHFGARAALGMGAVAALLAATGGGLALRHIRDEERAERQRSAAKQGIGSQSESPVESTAELVGRAGDRASSSVLSPIMDGPIGRRQSDPSEAREV
jgi:MFS family permease